MILTRSRDGTLSGRKMVLRSAYNVFKSYGDVTECFIPDENGVGTGILRQISIGQIVLNLFNVLFKGWSLNEALFFSYFNNNKINKILSNDSFDYIYVDSIRMMTYLAKYKGKSKIILDYDDLYSDRYQNMLEKKELNEKILGFYNNKFLKKIMGYSYYLIKKIVSFESRRVYKREVYYSKKSHFRILISRAEAEVLRNRTGKKIWDIPMIVPDHKNSWIKTVRNKRENLECCFIGNMDYYPNQQSLIYIRDEIIPFLENKGIQIKINVIGAYDNLNKNEYPANYFHFLGFVSNLALAASQTDVLLCPIISGTGIKTKILDGLSLGIPIITNEKGVEGLPQEVIQNILVVSCKDDYVKYIKKLKKLI